MKFRKVAEIMPSKLSEVDRMGKEVKKVCPVRMGINIKRCLVALNVSASMTVHVSESSLGRLRLLVDAQSIWSSTSLTGGSLAAEIAFSLSDFRASHKRVSAETLATELGSCKSKSASAAPVNALGGRDLLVSDIGKFDASKDTSIDIVRETTFVGVTCNC